MASFTLKGARGEISRFLAWPQLPWIELSRKLSGHICVYKIKLYRKMRLSWSKPHGDM